MILKLWKVEERIYRFVKCIDCLSKLFIPALGPICFYCVKVARMFMFKTENRNKYLTKTFWNEYNYEYECRSQEVTSLKHMI